MNNPPASHPATSTTPPVAASNSGSGSNTPRQASTLSSTALEEAKNHALLFFMDHLMSKSGARTIHDLSCQFGARTFTPEMREAVGSTQEGLQEFLAGYPSLFKIDGDSVAIAYGESEGSQLSSPLLQNLSKDRDYEQEAIEFFERKLLKFGPELQIKSLLGHRSQAAPEIRLVSGRHVKDFTEFLYSRPEHFVVEGDRVRLRNMPEPVEPVEVDENGQLLTGTRAKQAALDYLRSVLEDLEAPMPMDQLYQHFCNRFSHAVRQEVATNPKELLYFLKLNRTVFFIRSNKVSLVKSRPDSEGGSDDGENSSGTALTGQDSVDTASNASSNREEHLLEMISVLRSVKAASGAVLDILSSWQNGGGTNRDGMGGGGDASNGVSMATNGGGGQNSESVISVDFKLVSLGDQEFLGLVVVGTMSGLLYVFDVAHTESMLLESGLKDLLESSNWIKVIHDCKRVSSLLHQQYNIKLQRVFDTQVANLILQHQKTNKPLPEIKPISFLTLQRMYYPQSLMWTNTNPRTRPQRKDPRFWSVRPMSDEMILTAVEECHVLVPTIYQAMACALKPEHDAMFRQMCHEQIDYYVMQNEVNSLRKERRRNVNLININEKLARDPTGTSLSNRERRMLRDADNPSDDWNQQPPGHAMNGTMGGGGALAGVNMRSPPAGAIPNLPGLMPPQQQLGALVNGHASPNAMGPPGMLRQNSFGVPQSHPMSIMSNVSAASVAAAMSAAAVTSGGIAGGPANMAAAAAAMAGAGGFLPLRHPFPPPPAFLRSPQAAAGFPGAGLHPHPGTAAMFNQSAALAAVSASMHQNNIRSPHPAFPQLPPYFNAAFSQWRGGIGVGSPGNACITCGCFSHSHQAVAPRRTRSFIKPRTLDALTQTTLTGDVDGKMVYSHRDGSVQVIDGAAMTDKQQSMKVESDTVIAAEE